MAPSRPATTGYERLSQAEQFSDSDDNEIDDPLGRSFASLQDPAAPRYAPIGQPRPHSGMPSPKSTRTVPNGTYYHGRSDSSATIGGGRRGGAGGRERPSRHRSNSGVDLKAINARLERWADEIAAKFKRHRGKKAGEDERLEIHHTVFQAPEGVRPVTAETLADPQMLGGPPAMSAAEFEAVVESVRVAIAQGVHPRMISQGSSGSYFARNAEGRVVGVFKPKDEEPYAAGNPKWNKWIHRNLFPCCFGRACLIPNLSYVSEAAAYVLDCQLRTHLVPYTDVVNLSSKSFHYPFWDRYAHSRSRKPLPAKPGSFQVFLKGFKDANVFLREHPWPDQYLSGFRTSDTHRNRRRRWADNCRPSGGGAATATSGDDEDDEGGDQDARGRARGGLLSAASGGSSRASPRPMGPGNFAWTEPLKQAFREELEKLVILDYIMRNTDRGLDNWMIKVDWETEEVAIVSEPLHLQMEHDRHTEEEGPRPVALSQRTRPGGDAPRASYPYRAQQPMDASTPPVPSGPPGPTMSIGAIDNSLSWPWKHPDAWRSFPFGWLFLPVDLIGRPFSQRTRDHFLPLLTSTHWWSQTQLSLRRVFQLDPDFQERMFARQIAVMKGQAWNVVETLKTPDHGPLELTRRAKVCVWDDLVDVPVAVPMRATSSAEMRRQARSGRQTHRPGPHRTGSGPGVLGNRDAMRLDEGGENEGAWAKRRDRAEEAEQDEEADIAASSSSRGLDGRSVPPEVDLLGLASPPADLPHPGRFELASHGGDDEQVEEDGDGDVGAMASSNPELRSSAWQQKQQHSHSQTRKQQRPGLPAQSRSLNAHGAASAANGGGNGAHHERRYSFATAAGRRNSNSIAQQLYGPGLVGRTSLDSASSELRENFYCHYDDDVDGDLGFAAAEGMEGNRRKVIVERLEAVKSRNPVFTWC